MIIKLGFLNKYGKVATILIQIHVKFPIFAGYEKMVPLSFFLRLSFGNGYPEYHV